MFRFIRNIIITVVLIVSIFAGLFFVGQLVPYQYDKAYTGILRVKYEANKKRTEPGIIFVGGSNLALGLDTEKISKTFNTPAYNFGFHAGLKRDFYLNAIKANILEGDVIVLIFEYSAYIEDLMTEHVTWNSIDNDMDLIKCVPASNVFNLYRYYPIYLFKKISDTMFNPHPIPDNGGYNVDCFNEYGDDVYERYENIRTPEEVKNSAYTVISTDIMSDEGLEALKEFREYCESVGARVYASCPSIDRLGVKELQDNGVSFKKRYEEKTGIKMISEPSDYILDTEYFYDTDYHLNLTGVELRTNLLIEDLKTVL